LKNKIVRKIFGRGRDEACLMKYLTRMRGNMECVQSFDREISWNIKIEVRGKY
jgi:hypothetical protein